MITSEEYRERTKAMHRIADAIYALAKVANGEYKGESSDIFERIGL